MQLDPSRNTAQIHIAQCRAAEERIAEVPIFVSRVEIHLQASSRVVKNRRRNHSESAALFRIPSQQRSDVYRAMSDVVDLGIDRRVWHSTQQRDRALQLGISPTVALCNMQRGVKMFAGGRKLHPLTRKDTEILKPCASSEQRIAAQNLRSIESNRSVQQDFVESRRRLHSDVAQSRFVDSIPVFQRPFEIALQKVDRSEEIKRVGISRTEAKRRAQVSFRRGKFILLVIDSSQFHQKSRVVRTL